MTTSSLTFTKTYIRNPEAQETVDRLAIVACSYVKFCEHQVDSVHGETPWLSITSDEIRCLNAVDEACDTTLANDVGRFIDHNCGEFFAINLPAFQAHFWTTIFGPNLTSWNDFVALMMDNQVDYNAFKWACHTHSLSGELAFRWFEDCVAIDLVKTLRESESPCMLDVPQKYSRTLRRNFMKVTKQHYVGLCMHGSLLTLALATLDINKANRQDADLLNKHMPSSAVAKAAYLSYVGYHDWLDADPVTFAEEVDNLTFLSSSTSNLNLTANL